MVPTDRASWVSARYRFVSVYFSVPPVAQAARRTVTIRAMPASPDTDLHTQPADTWHIGSRRLLVRGLSHSGLQDLYFLSMTSSWLQFYCSIATLFILLNGAFATLYLLQPGSIANVSPGGFWGAFFFSVETLATVGYGDMHPATLYAHVLATLEIFTGMMGIAVFTGLTFARFSRPRARIIASRTPVVCQFDGQTTLMVRAANARKSMITHASARLYLLIYQHSPEGHTMRRLLDLKLVREVHPMFFLSWTLLHPIDSGSPLWGHDAASLAAHKAELILTISGSDEITSQDLHSRHHFAHQDIRWNHVFEDMLQVDTAGREHVNYERLHATREQTLPPA